MVLPDIIRSLLESGVHFGHLSKHWNPKMERFIFGKKKNIYIIDLEKTVKELESAKQFVKKIAEDEGKILFVSSKRQLKEVIKSLANSCGMPYVVERWVGGLLTNFSTIQTRIKKFINLMERRNKGEFEKLPPKEVVRLNRELERMTKMYSGVVSLNELPRAIYIVDPRREKTAVREANKLSIPIIALIDTDGDPEVIDYPIPGNDDAIKSVRFITQQLVDAILEGRKKEEMKKEETRVDTSAEEKEAEEVASQEKNGKEDNKQEGN